MFAFYFGLVVHFKPNRAETLDHMNDAFTLRTEKVPIICQVVCSLYFEIYIGILYFSNIQLLDKNHIMLDRKIGNQLFF